MLFFDIDFIDPEGYAGTMCAVIAKDENEARDKCPVMLSSNSGYTPQQFEILSVRKSIYREDSKE